MNLMFAFDGVEASKQTILTVGDSNSLGGIIEKFMMAHHLDCGRLGEYESDAAAMLYEIAHDPDTEYSYVTMYIDEKSL